METKLMTVLTVLTLALTMTVAPVAQADQTIYTNDFQSGDTFSEWSSNLVSVTPGTSQHPADRFLGEFGTGGVNNITFTLATASPHTHVTLSFDLYVLGTWDGNDQSSYGPDRWTLKIAGGPTLLDTTFSNVTSPPFGIPFLQSYPDPFLTANHPQFYGSVESRTLGYLYSGYNVDAVYRLSYTVPNTATTIAFDFTANTNGNVGEESFGLDNIVVTLKCEQPADLTGDCVVDMADVSVLAAYWLNSDCAAPDWCEGADMDFSSTVDLADLAVFAIQWLEGAIP